MIVGRVTPLLVLVRWLPVAACNKFKAFMLTFRTVTKRAPSYPHERTKNTVTDHAGSETS